MASRFGFPRTKILVERRLAEVLGCQVGPVQPLGVDRRQPPVSLVVSKKAGKLCVSVSDQGEGVSDANRARVFDRFFTTDRDRGGTGIGLAIVKAVADRQGGSVALEETESGARFVLTI